MYPHFFDWRKETAVPAKETPFYPCVAPATAVPFKGDSGTTGRIVIPNLHRRRSGSATVFILPRLLGCVCGRPT